MQAWRGRHPKDAGSPAGRPGDIVGGDCPARSSSWQGLPGRPQCARLCPPRESNSSRPGADAPGGPHLSPPPDGNSAAPPFRDRLFDSTVRGRPRPGPARSSDHDGSASSWHGGQLAQACQIVTF
jgi:hypothetical protein